MPLKKPKRKKHKELKEFGVKELKKKADAVFSIFIRKRDKGICITCEKQDEIKRRQAGHYITRACNELRFDEKNVHCQCVSCNIFQVEKSKPIYIYKLIKLYGIEIIEEFETRRKIDKIFKQQELIDIIEKYTQKVDQLN